VLSVAGLCDLLVRFLQEGGLFLGEKEVSFPPVYPRIMRVVHILDILWYTLSYVADSQECPKGARPWGYSRAFNTQQ